MFDNIKIGIQGAKTQIVKNKDTAKSIGSGLANVFATPALILLMENTAHESIEPLLPKGYSSVGTEINVKHIKASLPGAIVSCISTVKKVDGKKIQFTIEVSDNNSLIGTAEHVRYIVDLKEFMQKIGG